MSRATRKDHKLQRRRCRTFVECLRQFLTPEVFKQAHAVGPARRASRWSLQPLVFVLLSMTWCTGDSLEERFEAARGFYVACHVKRRRPGKTMQGLQAALSKLPVAVLRTLAAGVRRQILAQLGDRLLTWGWIVLGCDGSRAECPRAAELEARLGQAGKEHSAPCVWISALVHLRSGLLWAWRLGKGIASEQRHLVQMLGTLPAQALLVSDAAYCGYELICEILAAKASFLFRVSSKVWLYTDQETPLERFCEGLVYYWPQDRQRRGHPPLLLRLIRVPNSRGRDVWLLTNVLEPARLSLAMASRFYRWRWENEGLFRTYKRTLNKVKLMARTVRLVHREAEGSLLAVQLLLAHATSQLRAPRSEWEQPQVTSPRQVLIEIRREIAASPRPQRRPSYALRLRTAYRERRQRTSSKVARLWPRRKDHQPPHPPKLLTLTTEQKALRDKTITAS